MPAPMPIDREHLARQTMGDAALARELLDMFAEQAVRLAGEIRAEADGRRRGDLAHTLKGSARALGAWEVASAAEAVESEAVPEAFARLASSVAEAVQAIRDQP